MDCKSLRFFKGSKGKTLIWECIVAMIIILTPFILFTHLFFSNTDASLTILNFEFHHGFDGTRVFVWFVLVYLIAIVLMIIWYWECNYRWNWLILFSIIPWIDTPLRYTFYTYGILEKYIIIFSLLANILALMVIYFFKKKFKSEIKDPITKSFFNIYRLLTKKEVKYLLKSKMYIGDDSIIQHMVHIESLIKKEVETYYLEGKRFFNRLDVIIGLVFILSSILLYLDQFISPSTKGYEIFGFHLGTMGFENMKIFIFFLCLKLALLIPLVMWLLTSPKWYRFALLSPIILTSYQVWEIFQTSEQTDEIAFIYAVPWMIIVALSIIFLAKKINYVNKIIGLQKNIEKRINNKIVSLSNKEKEHKTFLNTNNIEMRKLFYKKDKAQLAKLISIRDAIKNQLENK
jgi:hypothetical protein